MIIHNLKLAIRQLLKYKLQTLLSLVGLAIGFTCFALSSLWWRYETTYDAFHPDADDLYIQVTSRDQWATSNVTSPFRAGHLAMDKIPQVEMATTFRSTNIRANEVTVGACFVDSRFLSVFQPELIAGSYPQMFPDDTSVVLTEKTAQKLFGTINCIGREVQLKSFLSEYDREGMWENRVSTVVAVVKGWGNHTIFPYDCLVAFKADEISHREKYQFLEDIYTVMRLHPMANADTVSALINKVQPMEYPRTKVVNLSDYRSEYVISTKTLVKSKHIRIFALLGLLVVICAVFNYLSLYTIRIRMRARELALRLVCGSSSAQLLTLLVTEFIILLSVACILGVMLVESILPTFKEITYIEEETSFFFSEMGIYMLVVALGTMPLLLGVTWWVQRQSLNETLHKEMVTIHRNLFRPFSQWLQLAVCMGLIFFTSVIILQLHNLRTHSVAGYTYENRATFVGHQRISKNLTPYLRSHPDVIDVKPEYNGVDYANYRSIGVDENNNMVECSIKRITRDEADFWGLELLAGRWMEDHEKDVAMLNESAVKFFNLNNPIDTILQQRPMINHRIVGVIRNTSAKSLIVPQEPVIYTTRAERDVTDRLNVISFSYLPGSWSTLQDSIISHLESIHAKSDMWRLVNVEEEFNRLLHSEDTMLDLFYVMTGVCVLIALFGVYSLITISCEQRRKEIAVRKVYGATVGDILRLFFGEQLVVLIASALVGFPIAYICVKPWLEGYIHQVDIPLWLCPAIFLIVALLVALCISWRVWRTAKVRPADEIE
ncbi:MAG: ABC transporter permease [Bacteroidaceae bacterium]|nr:ABC transporter permease [Bacteroidaceae bacterium]